MRPLILFWYVIAICSIQNSWASEKSIPIGLYSDSDFPSNGSLPEVRPWMQRHSPPVRAASDAHIKKKIDVLTQKLKQSEELITSLSAENSAIKIHSDETNHQIDELIKQKERIEVKNSELKKENESQYILLSKVQQEKEVLVMQLSQAKKNASQKIMLSNNNERTAYAAGQNYAAALGRNIQKQKQVGVELSRPELIAGLVDGLNHRNKLPMDEMKSLTDILDKDLNERLQKKENEMQKVSEEQLREGKLFYEKFLSVKGVKKDAEGNALYQILSTGKGLKIQEDDVISILLSGRLPDGKVFDDSGLKKKIQRIRADSILPSLTRGLTQIGKGGRIKIVLPPEEAFGADGFPPAIPGNSTLIFDIVVVDVKRKEK